MVVAISAASRKVCFATGTQRLVPQSKQRMGSSIGESLGACVEHIRQYRTSRTLAARLAMFRSLTLIAIIPALGEKWRHRSYHAIAFLIALGSVLEYITQDDADYAVRKLDNKELRGVPVRVEADVGDPNHHLLSYI